ncbi:MAG: MFS transporter [Alphaproteobacteria bacterium]|nr:MAG: MFS transporter [Alphaproteobacteria bacterium]
MQLARQFILVTVALDAIGIGLIMPVMPDLIRDVEAGSLPEAALWGGILTTAFAVMQFLFGPLVGNLSDRFGRRPVLLVSLFAMALDYAVMAIAHSIWLLLLFRLVGGVTSATHSTATAYMADISSRDEKAGNFGLVSAAFGIGFVAGPAIGGFLGEFGARAPFWAAAGLAFVNGMFGLLVLPETVTDRTRRAFSWRRANPLGALTAIARLAGLGRLVGVYFLYQIAFFVYPAVWAYSAEYRFGWSAGMVGLSFAAFGLAMAIVQGGLVRPVVRRLGEARTTVLGLSLDTIVFVAFAWAGTGWQVFALVPLAALGGVSGPAMQALMSQAVPDDQQGELQGLLTSAGALGMIISPILMTQTFFHFTRADAPVHFPGAPFLLAGILMLLALGLFLGGGRRPRKARAGARA